MIFQNIIANLQVISNHILEYNLSTVDGVHMTEKVIVWRASLPPLVPILVYVFNCERGGGFTVDSYRSGAAFSSSFTTHDVSDQYGVKELNADQEVYIHPHSTNV